MSCMKPPVHQAIQGVYEAFRDVPKPATVDGCQCCISARQIHTLLSKPLRALSPEDLKDYAASVLLTVGEVGDFLYFLPRMLEILASDPSGWLDPEVVLQAIHTAGFHSWPKQRQRALIRYFHGVIGCCLATAGSGWMLDSWICALGKIHVDLMPFLARIAKNGPRLIEFYEVNSQTLTDGRLANSFWDRASTEHKQVIDWFGAVQTQNAVMAQYGLA